MIKLILFLLIGLFSQSEPPKHFSAPLPNHTVIITPPINITHSVKNVVPFTVQAPFSEWKDPLQQDACEEASTLMAVKWARGEIISNRQAAKDEILAISRFEIDHYGGYHDTSTEDTKNRIFNQYYKFDQVEVKMDISKNDIIQALETGHLVITPMNGQIMGNPYFTPPGPERHNVLITGYDANTQQFITNDPGVTNGKDFRYPTEIFFRAIRDYPTGDHLPILEMHKNMLIVSHL